MQLMVFILNRTDILERIFKDLMDEGFSGATVLESRGMLRVFEQSSIDAPPIFGSIRKVLRPEHEHNLTVLMVVQDEQIQQARDVINNAVGGLDRPDTGILFTVPISFAEGIPLNQLSEAEK